MICGDQERLKIDESWGETAEMNVDYAVGKTCPFCQSVIKPSVPVVICPACGIPHHQDCWGQNGGCTTFGCTGNHVRQPQSVSGFAPPVNTEWGNQYGGYSENNLNAHLPASIPEELKGWNWGAFAFPLIWAISMNRLGWALCSLVPYLGRFTSFYLGYKGNELAWTSRRWQSAQQFKDTQDVWHGWGKGILIFTIIISFLGIICIAVADI